MEIVLNELSLEGQFAGVADFEIAIDNVMSVRKFKSELRCHRNLPNRKVTAELCVPQAANQFSNKDKGRALMAWITKTGPFWEDGRQHSSDDYFELHDNPVTDTGLGEVAYRCSKGSDYQIFSFESSQWKINPISVNWHRDENNIESINIINHWAINTFLDDLLNDFQPDKSNLPSLEKPFPNLNWSDKLVNLQKFREHFANYPADKQATIQTVADRITKINCYKFNQFLSTLNQRISNSYRKIYESVGDDKRTIYLSVDFEKGAFELCNHAGEHQGEYQFNGNKSGSAKLDHSIFLKSP
jgi:hypothetical protein